MQLGPSTRSRCGRAASSDGLLLRGVQPSGHHDGGARAPAPEFVDQRRARWPAACTCTARSGAAASRRPVVTGLAVERGVLGIDGVHRPGEAAGTQVAPHGRADAACAFDAPATAIARGSRRRSRLRTLIGRAWRDGMPLATGPARCAAGIGGSGRPEVEPGYDRARCRRRSRRSFRRFRSGFAGGPPGSRAARRDRARPPRRR